MPGVKRESRPGVERLLLRGMPGRIRTSGLWVRNPTLYPLSYGHAFNGARKSIDGRRRLCKPLALAPAEREGFEPSIEV